MLATRTQAVSLDRLAAAQVEVLYRTVARHERSHAAAAVPAALRQPEGRLARRGPALARRPRGPGRRGAGGAGARSSATTGTGADEEGDVGLRRSRGKKSWLRLPDPHARRLSTRRCAGGRRSRARRCASTVEVNGAVVATPDAGLPSGRTSPSWCPEASLRPGFNEVSLVYSTTPREVDPALRGARRGHRRRPLHLARRHRRDGPV